MDVYPKIQSLFKRTDRGLFIEGEYATTAIEYLKDCEWQWTEKVDGTNIRIGLVGVGGWPSDGYQDLVIRGKTDNAQIHTRLFEAILGMGLLDKMKEVFGDSDVTLYGEGYGPKIQSGGNYRPDQSFVLFDVKIGGFWLRRADVEDVAAKLGIDVVPLVAVGTIAEARGLVDHPNDFVLSDWGDFKAEGLVGRPAVDLVDRMGNRVMVKLKHKDFDRLRRETG